MTQMMPARRPQRGREWAESFLTAAGIDTTKVVAVFSARGFFLNSMGEPGRNDRGIYDDAFFIVGPGEFASFNANADPSVGRTGIAVLKAGVWDYKPGIHGLSKPKNPSGSTRFVSTEYQYRAYVQAGPVTVIRDGTGPDTGWFGINIHRGSRTTTSSLGCQTVHPDQWFEFDDHLIAVLRRLVQPVFKYCLVEAQG